MTQMTKKLVFFIFIVLGISSITALGLHILSVKGAILVEGHITSDTTWMPTDTYQIVSDTYVDPSVTLSIKPGVQVHFEDNVSLIVEGSLNASGTESDPILFTSSRVADNPSDPYPGAWNTTRFNGNASEQFVLRYVNVEYAVYGVTIESLGMAIIEKSELANCSESGIKLIGESNAIIRGNVITCNKNGITTDYASIHAGIIVTSNEISNNNENGVYLYSYNYNAHAYVHNVTFSSNTISSNGEHGIFCRAYVTVPPGGGGESYIYDVSFSSNTIRANGKTGVYLDSAGIGPHGIPGMGYGYIHDISFSSNTISANSENGVYLCSRGCAGDASIYDVSFLSNTVSSNGQTGLNLYSWSWVSSNIYNVNLSSNMISLNGGNGVFLSAVGEMESAYIYDVSFLSNTISSNDANGVTLSSSGGTEGERLIYNAMFSSNTISRNLGDGLYLTCSPTHTPYYCTVYNVSLLSNTISANNKNGVYANVKRHQGQMEFDFSVSNNNISANNEKGFWIDGEVNANFSTNSISSNSHGIYLNFSSNNIIRGNNITNNEYGIWLEHSYNNKIEDNNFVNNTQNVHIGTSSSAEFDAGGDDNDGYPLVTCIVIAIAIIAGVIGALLVYFTKVKKTTEKTKQ